MKLFTGFNTQLAALKLMVFCWFAAAACLMPYMSIHMKVNSTQAHTTNYKYY